MTEKSNKKKIYKTISDVVKILNMKNSKYKINQAHTLRYWETQFKQIKPKKINNRRYYDQKNIDRALIELDGSENIKNSIFIKKPRNDY